MVEMTFAATGSYDNPFREASLEVVFHTPQGHILKVPAFWAGDRVWKVRYASPELGTHRWQSACSIPEDRGLHGHTGMVTVEPYVGQNPPSLAAPCESPPTDGTLSTWMGRRSSGWGIRGGWDFASGSIGQRNSGNWLPTVKPRASV